MALRRIPLDRGGYDKSGRYWGAGGKLYVYEWPDGSTEHTRAVSPADARKRLGLAPAPKRHRAKGRHTSPSHAKFHASLAKTEAVRGDVQKDLLPLFDHIVSLAKEAHKRSAYKQAGIELRMARKLGYRIDRAD
jgi:hypothetical protein